MVQRVYVEKKPGLSPECDSLLTEWREVLGIKGLKSVRVFNRYDAEGLDEASFAYAKATVFSEPQTDVLWTELPTEAADDVFAVEPLPGQFDQRADSAAQCIQMLSQGERPTIRSAKIYALCGELTDEDKHCIRRNVINPVESREASLELPESLIMEASIPSDVPTITGMTGMDENALQALSVSMGLAMDADDLRFLQTYFRETEQRDPTVTEVRVVDTYWSDHCRHTTFSTQFDHISIESPAVQAAYERYLAARVEVYGEKKAAERPQNLMDIATIGAKLLKKRGLLPELDLSDEINACSIHVPAVIDGREQEWLLMFKNETHNHPTEIEPFGGAATCIGGCIRDPLSGRAFVHQAMRVSGAADPRRPLSETIPGKLSQRKLCRTAAAGYSSYGNQIGLATGHVAELYHPGYAAKRLECGAVVAAAPVENIIRESPLPGDLVILLGGRTGRDGIGGATGSSKSHDRSSLVTMASEVQKGNAPEERKIQRLFRRPDVTRLIKRCNDFGAGGVAVAIGELAEGLIIDLDAVRKKYEGLDGTEIAISESQERMAVVVSPENAEAFITAAHEENLEASRVAVVTEEPRMVMRWRGQTVVSITRAFLDTNGAVKHTDVAVTVPSAKAEDRVSSLRSLATDLSSASRRGLVQRFDSTVGAYTLLMPYGGLTQTSPSQAMAALLPVLPGHTTDQASVMAWGCDPYETEKDPYLGAKNAVYTSVAKLVAAGADYRRAYLTLQEFFEKLRDDPTRWGKPFAALLGALDAQLELSAAAIGGKDSMSGSFMDMDVPPTVISFAISPILSNEIITTDFKAAGHGVYLFSGFSAEGTKNAWGEFLALAQSGKVAAAWAVENCPAEAIMKMSFGNEIGFSSEYTDLDWYASIPGAIIAELTVPYDAAPRIGVTTSDYEIRLPGESASIRELRRLNESVLSGVYPTDAPVGGTAPLLTSVGNKPVHSVTAAASPRALIPVFPGTNCEYETQNALLEAGAKAETFVIRNLTAFDVAESAEHFAEEIRRAQMIVIPGGFSGGDEPDGSAKFITAFFRAPAVREAVSELMDQRGGLMLGICNGFQALIKLGLVPFGKISETDASFPTLTYNVIGRHQSGIVRTRVCTDNSPWLRYTHPGEIYCVPISHGEGRFLASAELVEQLARRGQIVTQYVDYSGTPSMETAFNPNGSVFAVEGICSPDGRVLGKMGHCERIRDGLYRNVPGRYDMQLFSSAVSFFRR